MDNIKGQSARSGDISGHHSQLGEKLLMSARQRLPSWSEVRGAAELPVMHRMTATTENYPPPRVSRAKAEKPCDRVWHLSWGKGDKDMK